MALYDQVKGQAGFGYGTPAGPGSTATMYQPPEQKKGLFGGGSDRLRPVKTSKMMLKADLNRLQTDPDSLGLTQSQQENMIAQSTQAARTGAQAQTAALSRDALAGQGFQAGAFSQAQQGVADTVQDAAVQAAPGVHQLHTALVQQEKARILGDLDAARERTRENTRFWMQFGVDAFSSMMSTLNSGSGAMGMLGGGGGGGGGGAAAPAAATSAIEAAPAVAGMAAMSARDLKTDIQYITEDDAAKYHGEVMDMQLALWKYTPGLIDDQTRLGIIIDDAPDATMVAPDQRTIDLYTYASMMAAALQHQARMIDDLREELHAFAAQRND